MKQFVKLSVNHCEIGVISTDAHCTVTAAVAAISMQSHHRTTRSEEEDRHYR